MVYNQKFDAWWTSQRGVCIKNKKQPQHLACRPPSMTRSAVWSQFEPLRSISINLRHWEGLNSSTFDPKVMFDVFLTVFEQIIRPVSTAGWKIFLHLLLASLSQMTVKGSGLLSESFNDSHPCIYALVLYEGAQTGFLEQSCDTEQIRASFNSDKGRPFIYKSTSNHFLSHLDIHTKAEC